jgi:hypothetical protein
LLSAAALHLLHHPRRKAVKSRSRSSTVPTAALGPKSHGWAARPAHGSPDLAYFDTRGVSNGGTEAINLIIEKVRRLTQGFKDFDHYRLLAAMI